MKHARRDESPDRHFRSDRVVMARGRWYIVTRERMDIGPYQTREEAEIAAEELVQALDGVEDPAVVLAFINEFARRRHAMLETRRLATG